jgi:RNA polymerase sigma-70 factor (ECF subfamily)
LPLRVSRDLELQQSSSLSSGGSLPFDEAAFELLFKEKFTSLCCYCQVKFGFDIQLSKEAVHTGFMKLWENRMTLSPDMSIKAFLQTCIINTCLDMIRHQKVVHKHEWFLLQREREPSQDPVFDSPDMKSLSADIDNAVSGLPEQMRKVFELSRYHGLKYAEISSYLNISVKTVETQMSRALVKLREKLFRYLILLPVIFFPYF